MPYRPALRALLLASGLSATPLIALPGMAQEAETEARLPQVTVTAQRVEQNLQDVPISVTTVADEKLDVLKASGADVRFLSARVPSVIAESSFGRAFPRFYIRGIGNIDFDLNSSQPVSLVYDDVPYESPILKGFPVFDLAGIEVLRGPQGTLFGRNTPGGIIKFDSARPVHELEGYARASYGTYNTRDLEGAINLPVFKDQLAVRLSGLYQERDAYVDNAFTSEKDRYEGFKEVAGRAQVLFTPTGTDFSALLNLHGRTNDGDARLFRANIIDPGSNGVGSNFDRDTVYFDGDNFLTQDAHGVTLRLDQALTDAINVTYVFGNEQATIASRGDIDGGFGATFLGAGNYGPGPIPFPSESSGAVDALHQTTNEIRVAFDNGGPVRAQAGVFVFDEKVSITSKSFDTLAPGRPVNGIATRENQTDSTGIFVSLAYDLTDRLTLSGGARWTDESKDFAVERTLGPFGAPPLGPITGSVGDDQVSWDVSAAYQATDAINLYARIAKGFRGPSTQGRLVFGDTVSSAGTETVLSYEAGVKSELFDHRVRLNTNVFFYDFSDQQLTIVGGTNNTVALFNADKSEGYGFEADIEATPIEHLLLTGGLSYNKTEFKDDVLLAPGCGGGCTVTDPAVYAADGTTLLGYDISGNSFPNAPEWIANFTARYAIPFRSGEFYGYTDWAYKGDSNFFLYESLEYGQDGYWEGGLKVGYKADAGYDVSVFGRNIMDEDALTGAIDFNNLTGFVNEPATWGIQLRWDF
ncbi:TonB-dependent receptor [Hyphomonas johnsonii]|uniref:TonB-dependent receptor n=1 Tax=Hyphomonas johnsonii MHS-2 TaxID=1280950 RepID=A0A059F9Q0_9PROT|nr:TonB-dependent receptor [Hyphomonas johnsonii]KCZ87339.1 TonB-dependent receptor [Hyphomonas johnsonii MHS-2]